jgi:O-antigen ligase
MRTMDPRALTGISKRRAPLELGQLPFIAIAILAFAIISAVAIQLSGQAGWIIFTPLIAIGAAVAVWIIARAVGGSTTAIITYLVLVLFITDGQFRARGAGEIGTDWQSALKFALWMGAGIIGVANAPPIRVWLRRPGAICWLAYIVMAMVSSFYAPAPVYSFGCGFAMLCLLPFAFTMVDKLPEGQFLWTLTITLAVFLAIGWVVYYADPTLGSSVFWTYGGIELRMCGIAGQANNLGAICAKYLGAIFLLWLGGRCRLRYALPLAALGIATLSASDARTGMIAVVVASAIVLLARSMKALIGVAVIAVTGTLATLVFSISLDALGSHFSRSGDPTEVYTLTGRIEIWQFIWEKITERPLFGWGYSASKILLPEHLTFQDGLMVDTAHNMLLQSLLSVGFIGTLPAVAIILYLLFNAIYRPYPFRDLFVLIVVISAISDTSALGTTPTVLTLLLFMASLLPSAPARHRRRLPATFAMKQTMPSAGVAA